MSYEFNPSMDFLDIYSDKNAYNKLFYDEILSQDIDSKGKPVVLSNTKTLDFFIYPDSLEKYVLSGSELTMPQLAIHYPMTIPTNFMKLQRGYW